MWYGEFNSVHQQWPYLWGINGQRIMATYHLNEAMWKYDSRLARQAKKICQV